MTRNRSTKEHIKKELEKCILEEDFFHKDRIAKQKKLNPRTISKWLPKIQKSIKKKVKLAGSLDRKKITMYNKIEELTKNKEK